jgi:uncharacterized protein
MSNQTAFMDSAYLIALAIESDELHPVAQSWAERAEGEDWSFLTTWPVMLEIGNALAKPRYRDTATRLLNGFLDDPTVTVVSLSEDLLKRGIARFGERKDKNWSLTDCISFLVMEEAGLGEALTFDEHFEQAGFKALLRTN